MQYQQKKKLEWLLVDYFKEVYTDFPKGRLTENESPDFLLTVNNKFTIGIELTRLYPESGKAFSQNEQEQVGTRIQLIDTARNYFEKKSTLKCFVKFLFSSDINPEPERVLSRSVKISGIISEGVKGFNPDSFNMAAIIKGLPPGIEVILVLYRPGMEYSVWEPANNLGISANLLDDIKFSIRKKDDKLKLYRKQQLNEYWLLITTDKLRQKKAVNVDNLMLNVEFESQFKKVFIMELVTGNVLCLSDS